MTIGKWLSNIFWLWVEHQSLILSWTSKLGWSSKVCCTNWYSQKCCVTNICTKTEWPCYICIQINAIQLHWMIFPYVYGWDDLLKSTKEVSLVKPLNQIKPLHPNHIVVYNHTDLGMFGKDVRAQESDWCESHIFCISTNSRWCLFVYRHYCTEHPQLMMSHNCRIVNYYL